MLYAKHASWGVLQHHIHSGTGAPTEFLFPFQPRGALPWWGLAVPQQNEQLKDELHPFLLIVAIPGREIL